MILVDLKPNGWLKLQVAHESPDDRDKIQSLPFKQLVTVQNSQGHDVWDHWEVPFEDVSVVFETWQGALIPTPAAQALHERYLWELIPTSQLPKIPSEGQYFSKPNPQKDGPDPDQMEYILASPLRPRSANFGDPGTGKTYMSLERARRFPFSRMLVLAPRAPIDKREWQSAIKKAYGHEPLVYLGSAKERAALGRQVRNHAFVVSSYEVFHEMDPTDFDSYILDEAHLWSNSESDRYRRLEPFIQASWRQPNICFQPLTGTPIGNQFTTIWAVQHSVSPLVAGSIYAFKKKHIHVEKMAEKFVLSHNPDGSVSRRKVFYAQDTSLINADLFKAKLDATSHRISEDDVLDFKRTTKLIEVDMTLAQKDLYLACRDDLLDGAMSSQLGLKTARVKMLRLLQIAEGPFNLPGEEFNFESGKLKEILRRLVSANKKVVVWSRFKNIVWLLHYLFPDRSVVWAGDAHKDDKMLGAMAFNGIPEWDQDNLYLYKKLAEKRNWTLQPGQAQFFFGVLDLRSSLGINLPACDYQIFSSFSLATIVNIQASRRIIRRDQMSAETLTEVLIARDTWERKAFTYLLNKWKDAKAVLDGKEAVSKNDMLQLLEFLGPSERQSRWVLRD